MASKTLNLALLPVGGRRLVRALALLFMLAALALAADSTWTQQQELTASNAMFNDQFGRAVSVSGNTAVIGADGKNGSQGAAYVFVRSAGVWSQQAELTASDGAAKDGFGSSVSLSGDTLVIGADGKNSSQGVAYVFVRSAGVWSQQAELTASDGAAGDNFGFSVSVSTDTLVIGAFEKNDYQGAAYVFVLSGGIWSQQQKLTASDGAASDNFGSSVSLSGDTTMIGAPGKNGLQGATYVFVLSGGTWSQQQKLTASDGAAQDAFGYSVSVSGTTAVIGAVGKNTQRGAAYVFVLSGGVWSQQQELTASDGAAGDAFGSSVSVSGSTAVIGAWAKTVNSLTYQGAAYGFVLRDETWGQQQEVTASDGAGESWFGYSVSVSGNTALIGAYVKSGQQGAAYVFVHASRLVPDFGVPRDVHRPR
ncbi:MAG: FG-GAP repeat protein [Bryobacteraceae bacterium]